MPGGNLFTPEEDAIILRLMREQPKTYGREAARLTGRSQASIQHRAGTLRLRLERGDLATAGARAPVAPEPPRDPLVVEQERIERLRRLREEKRELADVAGEKSLRAMIEVLFRDIVPTIPPLPPTRMEPRKRSRRAPVKETALLEWSDWHYGEVVKAERVRGFNAYDQDIGTARVRSVVENARGILRRLRQGGYEFPRAVIAANGDFVTGSIHDLEKHANGKSVVESVVECGYLFAEAVRSMAADFEQVDVFCTVGNHGRLPDARRMEQKSPLRNWDALVYFFAQCALRDVKNVTVTIPDSYAVGYEVQGLRVLQQHGHEVKSWMGIPWYGIERYVSRITALEAHRNTVPDVYLFGHFHTATSLPHSAGETFINGSLIGGTEYSVNSLGKSDRPTQWLLGVHAEHGVTHRWPVYPSGVVTSPRAA